VNSATQTERKAWRPDKGDVNPLVGRLADVTTATGQHGAYPLAEIVDQDGCTWSFHAFREVAESELRELAPEIGDEISVHWLGIPSGKAYHQYRIRFADGRGKKIDWGRVGSGEPIARDGAPAEESDEFAPRPTTTTEYTRRALSDAEAAKAAGGDDDSVPF
jgi:hypothetical protein